MKKTILLGIFALAAFGTKAQTLELIPKAGINISKQTIEGLNGEKMKVGFQGGVGLNIAAANSGFSIQPELNFITKGTKLKTASLNRELTLNYLEVPLLAKYSFGPVYINAGPSLGLMLDKKTKVQAQYGQELKKMDFGLQMGAGVAIPIGPGKVIIDGRYGLGLSNLGKTADLKNRGILASVGYSFPL